MWVKKGDVDLHDLQRLYMLGGGSSNGRISWDWKRKRLVMRMASLSSDDFQKNKQKKNS
jgi:hypothetical protein